MWQVTWGRNQCVICQGFRVTSRGAITTYPVNLVLSKSSNKKNSFFFKCLFGDTVLLIP